MNFINKIIRMELKTVLPISFIIGAISSLLCLTNYPQYQYIMDNVIGFLILFSFYI